ncbi:MAG TPA: hypothetical protein VFK92_18680 [Burkholderiales bacterium]|nr:hypothetical protein [Burkholderiales bacterium]
MDTALSDEALWARAGREARKQPDFKPIEAWSAELARRMDD